MPTYSDLSDLANNYNFTGNLSGTSSVPGLSLDEDEQGNYIITYTHLVNPHFRVRVLSESSGHDVA